MQNIINSFNEIMRLGLLALLQLLHSFGIEAFVGGVLVGVAWRGDGEGLEVCLGDGQAVRGRAV